MAIGLTGSPQQLTPGYNPMYFYATSTNVLEDSFRYLVTITNYDTSVVLADLKVLPRYLDNQLEINISKIIDNDLGVFTDDLDLNSSDILAFNNTISSGFRYQIDIGEEFKLLWEFADTTFNTGSVQLVSLTASPYVVGDEIVVTDAAEYFEFSDNQFDVGSVGFLMSVNPVGVINIGDTVTIEQDPGFTYPQYNGTFEVTAVTSTVVTVNFSYQGSTPPQGGTLIRNFNYDGIAIVTDTGVVSGGPYNGYYYIEYGQSWIDNSPTHVGTVEYADGRAAQFRSLYTDNDLYTFNGASGHKPWLSWDGEYYDPSVDPQGWLTNLPDNWTVSLEDDVFLNNWTRKSDTFNDELILRTYDSNSAQSGTYSFENGWPYTQIQAIPMGPRSLNMVYPNIIQNGTFQSTSYWTIVNNLGGTASISSGSMSYTDSVGDGEALAWQYDALIVGCEYLVTLTSTSNIGVGVQIGDTSVQQTIITSGQTGTFTASFTSADPDFVIAMSSGIVGQNDGVFDDVIVQQLCPIIDCDVATYTLDVYDKFGVTQSQTRNFTVDCLCAGRYTNYPILFMDRFGSMVSYDFSLNNKQTVDVDRDLYKKFVGGSNNGTYTYDTTEHSNRIYNVDLEEKWELNTDYMTEQEAVFFEQLVSSPIAMILIDNEYQAVNITDKRYERKNRTTKLRRYMIKIDFSNNNTINV